MFQQQWNHLRQLLGNMLVALRDMLVALQETTEPAIVTDLGGGNQKDFIVPAGEEWSVLGILIQVVTDATLNNRWPQVQIIDPTTFVNVYGEFVAGVSTPPDSMGWYQIGAGLTDAGAFRGPLTDWASFPIPPNLLVPADHVIRVMDRANISPGDTFDVYVSYSIRTVG